MSDPAGARHWNDMSQFARFVPVLLSGAATFAQAVQPPFDAAYVLVDVGQLPGIANYCGTAFLPNDPNRLLVSPYLAREIRSVSLVRNSLGYVVGTSGFALHATVGGTDGGLCFGPGGALFATWFGPNRLSQVLPGATLAQRVDDLGPLGVATSVGAVTFVPSGLPGAGRCLVASYFDSRVYHLPLTPDGAGTFTPGPAGPPIPLSGGIEGLVHAPAAAPVLGGHLLVCEWQQGVIACYQIDGNGEPLAATRQVVVSGVYHVAGGAVDPLTGDIFFTASGGRLLALRHGDACGTITAYGQASPGAVFTPTLAGSGCPSIGRRVDLTLGGAPGSVGWLTLGHAPLNVPWNGLWILQTLDAQALVWLDPTGHSIVPLGIPFAQGLAAQHFYLQAAFLDASTSSGLAASAGLDMFVR